ncbi:Serine phosphatase RsbU, regulator of sigma subunit [Asanoa hainanensis]|uniref:Serine phosphatase RsbU, regulator of sigma subunit n=1 Tax=Asanoa hainanensis TaxID=560556 RepID=A0A239PDS0_9ACTN|nr:PP2C family protein-serine/threonine phosphatase [Asanoa hainanensis]SNT65206.1 Serine phosphatase RsbU, regulator of sigma subunit [Asanoa hainanensis]
MNERLVDVERALSRAEADAIVERLGDQLKEHYGITEADLLLVDYRLSALLPLAGGEAVTKPGHPAWRSFDHQSEVYDEPVLFLPVTMRGDRIGVLRLAPVAEDDDVARAELADLATHLAHEVVAVRGSTDRYLVAARARRLTLAAEMQWELLPGRSRSRPSFALAGQLEPAYAVRGDSFDWADDAHRLWLSAVNGSGEGIAASTLTSLATFALRNARRGGLDLADQAALADQAVYAHYRGEQHLAALLLQVDLASGVVTAVDAGSPQLLLLRGEEVSDVELEAQLPLGMFDGTIYRPQTFELAVGDRLFVISDGVYDALDQAGSRYGESALTKFVRRSRHRSPLDAVRALLGELRAHVSTDLVDDAVVVCLDWNGPKAAP